MRIANIVFDDFNQLKKDLLKHQIGNAYEQYFIQIFMGITDQQLAQEIIHFLNNNLKCTILLTQSGKEIIANKDILEHSILLSISCFKHSSIKNTYCSTSMSAQQIATHIKQNLITPKTKLLVIFISCGSFYNQNILEALEGMGANLIICGGRSHPFENNIGLIGDNHHIYNEGLVCASIDSDVLYVQNNFIFGWESIGLSMTITKAVDNIVYEINGKKALDVYKNYLGEDVIKDIMTTNCALPLVRYVNNIPIACAVIEIGEDDSLIFNDVVPQGAKVNFCFGLLENLENENHKIHSKLPDNVEGIYFYSCVSRIMLFGKKNMSNLLGIFNTPSAGFFTYGEIYCSGGKNFFLGMTNTFVSLIEGEPHFSNKVLSKNEVERDQHTIILNAISHLMGTVNQEVLQLANKFESYQKLVDEMMLHVLTDEKLQIVYANKQMSETSLFDQKELTTKNFLELIDSDMHPFFQQEVLPKLHQYKAWGGKIKQIKKDGSCYYTKIIIKALLNEENQVTNYLIGKIDDTADELTRISLENNSSFFQRSDKEKKYLLEQYEDIIKKSQSLFRLDLNKKITYVNDIFLELTSLKLEDIVNKNIYDFIQEEEQDQFRQISNTLAQDGVYQGILQYTRPDKKKIYIRSIGRLIKDLDNNPIEIIATGIDITPVINSMKEIEGIQKDVIYTMGTVCEGKSRETSNHIIRVAEYSALLAKLFGCSKEEQDLLRTTSPMHDIGKIAIPDSILNKPGKLTKEEFEIMKQHTTIGQNFFKNSKRSILKTAGEIAGTHHEWWNGQGYPNNLKYEEIPLYGRITALADVFDALSNDRCYKKAWDIPRVLDHIASLRGKQFQPELTDLLLDNIDAFLEISKRYQDAL